MPLEQLLLTLGDATGLGTWNSGDGLIVHQVDLDVPVESRFTRDGVEMTLPRNRLATGFDPPLGRLRARFERSAT
jgi:hypothetical protein